MSSDSAPEYDSSDAREITTLLDRWQAGEESAFEQLLPVVYRDLRLMAHKALATERIEHSMQASDLVHEAYLRLARTASLEAHDRRHFFAVAARAMRRILIDHARRKLAQRRIGPQQRLTLDEALHSAFDAQRVLGIDEGLTALARRHERAAKLVELRFFGGFSESESADILGVSTVTASRDWRFARVWLLKFFDDNR
ncbi:MAG: ECF-type sigma factor [Acidobacteriota bacterium]